MDCLPFAGAGGEDQAPQESPPIGGAFPEAHHQAKVSHRLDVERSLADDMRLNLFCQR